jgi:hypothetical protein
MNVLFYYTIHQTPLKKDEPMVYLRTKEQFSSTYTAGGTLSKDPGISTKKYQLLPK